MNEKELSIELNKWFESGATANNQVWCRNPVGKILKSNLKSIGNWKNKKRGNPSKGARVKKENQFKNLYGDSPENNA